MDWSDIRSDGNDADTVRKMKKEKKKRRKEEKMKKAEEEKDDHESAALSLNSRNNPENYEEQFSSSN